MSGDVFLGGAEAGCSAAGADAGFVEDEGGGEGAVGVVPVGAGVVGCEEFGGADVPFGGGLELGYDSGPSWLGEGMRQKGASGPREASEVATAVSNSWMRWVVWMVPIAVRNFVTSVGLGRLGWVM